MSIYDTRWQCVNHCPVFIAMAAPNVCPFCEIAEVRSLDETLVFENVDAESAVYFENISGENTPKDE